MTDLAPERAAEHADQMDRMYRYTRHVYDATRRYYLFGRDRLLKMMAIHPGDRVLEMGCGTARNLIKLHQLYPDVMYFGLDASQSMLDTAAASLVRRSIDASIALRHGLAEQLDHAKTFGVAERFEVIFFSYSLSMMATWPQALDAALANLQPTGTIYIVDFWDQAALPRPFAWLLKKWLALFNVHYRPELLEHLHALENAGRCTLNLESLAGRYAYLATIKLSLAT